jgi:Domain of unknown function (DUF4129)
VRRAAAALATALALAPDALADPRADAARRQAHEILSQRRYRGSSVPRPLHGALVWLGEKLAPLARPVHWLGDHIPGGDAVVWAILGALVVLAAALLAGRTAQRRGGRRLERGERERLPSRVDPAQLERAADEAERAGDLERALRLRFRAGLLRLGRARVIPLRESVTSGEVRRILRLRDFDLLARTHDEVVYGGRPPSPDDTAHARETWPRVLDAARGRG